MKDHKFSNKDEYQAHLKEMNVTDKEHKKWHKEHDDDPEFWANKYKNHQKPKNKY